MWMCAKQKAGGPGKGGEWNGNDLIRCHCRGRDPDRRADRRSQAVTDTKLEELTREVREHNNFARRVPILEEQMKVANHRIADLEQNEKVRN